MSNPYYTPGSFTPHTKVTAESVNDEFSNVEDGFDAVETAITDAESAVQTSATAAADSATAAAASALSAANAKTDAESAKTAAETAQTNAETAETNAETAQAAAEEASLGLKYTFDNSTTMADPTAGYLRLNNATIASVTEIALDDTCAFTGNPDMSAYLLTWDDSDSATKGHVILRNMSDAADFAVFALTGLTDETGWVRLAVTYVTSSGSFSDESDVAVSFFRTGDRGQAGAGTGDMQASTYDPATIAEQLVGLTASQTLTNKTIDADNNTISNLAIGAEVTGASTALTDTADITYNADTDVSSNGWVLDEDTMSSDSATKVPTQQSTKAYVDKRKKTVSVNLFSHDEAVATGDGAEYYVIPEDLNGADLVLAHAHVFTASSSGTPTFQIHNLTQAADMLSTAITIDANETDSKDATTAPVIDTANDDVATGDVLRFDCDVAGTGTQGAQIRMQFRLP